MEANAASRFSPAMSDFSEEEFVEVKKGPWTAEEDALLLNYVNVHGEGRWNSVACCAGEQLSQLRHAGLVEKCFWFYVVHDFMCSECDIHCLCSLFAMLLTDAGLKRTGKSCRLRWLNYLRPDLRRGSITLQEQLLILELHSRWGNR